MDREINLNYCYLHKTEYLYECEDCCEEEIAKKAW